MRREGKAGPFIPSEVWAHTGAGAGDNACGRAQASSGDHNGRRLGESVPARVTTFTPERQRLRPGENACARATTHAPVRRRVLRGRGVFSQTPQTSALGRRCLRLGDNACARVRTHARGRQRMRPCDDGCRVGGVFFHKHPKLQRSGDNACVRVTTSALARQRLDPGVQTFEFFCALAIQSKLFHYLFLKIIGTVLKMVIQSYFY